MAKSQAYWQGKPPKILVSAQFDQALVCLEDLTKGCKGLYNYAKKRFALEKEYAKGLQKLARSSIDASLTPKGVQFQGNLGKCWHSILQATLECAEMKLSSTVNLEHSVLASLGSVFDGELSRSRKDLSGQGHQSVKNLQEVVQVLNKAQGTYVNGAQDWQTCLLQLHRELGGEWRALENPKQRDKEGGLSRKCEEAKQAYLAAIRQANNTQHLHHFDQMPPLLTQLSELSEDMVVVARQSVVHLLEQAELLQRSVAQQVPRVPVAPQLSLAKSLDPKAYTNDFIFCHMTADMVEPPRPFVFEEFLMEDDAAHLFFQKTRYECLQAFPTADTLDNDVIRQIDDDGFFIGSETFYQAPESDQDRIRRHMSASTDNIPVPNSRSSVAYMLALRKAAMQSKGDPAAPLPSSTEAKALPTWFARRRRSSNMNGTPTGAIARQTSKVTGSNSKDDAGRAKQSGKTSWYVEEEDDNAGIEDESAAAAAADAAGLSRRSRSEGNIFEHSTESVNPYASVDSVLAAQRSTRIRPIIPPRPSFAKRARSQTIDESPRKNSSDVSSPELPASPPPPITESAEQGPEDVMMLRDPPPLPGESEEDVYSAPGPVGSPGSPSYMPTERVGYLAPLPFLVQVCTQFLSKKRALQEEGLFRVSGDITRIRQLKAAFDALENSTNSWSSGRSLASFLESEIQRERDPNTVAGLLKMFLREQNYIDSKQCKSLVDALYPNRTVGTLQGSTADVSVLELAMREQLPKLESGDPVKLAAVKNIVREELTPVAQSVLAAMCNLLRKVANEGQTNRMTNHSLGMCCGISVFPAMSTGHASSVLRFMVSNAKDVFVANLAT